MYRNHKRTVSNFVQQLLSFYFHHGFHASGCVYHLSFFSDLTCADVAHLAGYSCLLHSCHAVTTTNDGDGTLAGDLSQGVGNAQGTLGKRLKLKHAHGSIPHHSLHIRQGILEGLDGVGADVQTLEGNRVAGFRVNRTAGCAHRAETCPEESAKCPALHWSLVGNMSAVRFAIGAK